VHGRAVQASPRPVKRLSFGARPSRIAARYALIIVLEFGIGDGRLIIESEARAEASGMMVAVIVLMLVGVTLSAMIWRLQAYLLRWRQHNMVE
jgi:ABC-type nitrate/sulfonate/bicarbonate transport system permease component